MSWDDKEKYWAFQTISGQRPQRLHDAVHSGNIFFLVRKKLLYYVTIMLTLPHKSLNNYAVKVYECVCEREYMGERKYMTGFVENLTYTKIKIISR